MLPDLETGLCGMGKRKEVAQWIILAIDVRDAMEETISGGRKEKNPRPTINGYMYGNAKAISAMNNING